MLSARSGIVGATVLVAALTLTGCGTDGTKAAAAASPSETVPPSASAAPTAPLPTAGNPGDISTTTTETAVPVPTDGGPTGIQKFPVPKGVKINGPAPQAKSWQFDILTKDIPAVLAFYRQALAAQGYAVRNNVTELNGDEKVQYDIAFTGAADGYIVADKSENDVFVLVQSPP
ncbi:MAG: hypothetical protein JWO46_1758, partial [Nocardioidaceae bacterium]|nr:hypothetical protein [Nocardioidaceae bacterium]